MAARKIETLEDVAFLLSDQLAGMERMGGMVVNPAMLMPKIVQNQTVMMTALLLICAEMAKEKKAKLSSLKIS